MAIPRLKGLFCGRHGDRLVVSLDPRERVELVDSDGRIAKLLQLLSEGTRDESRLAAEIDVSEVEIQNSIDILDGLGWIENAEAEGRLTPDQRNRHYSNLAFLDCFSTFGRSSAEMQERVLASHVAILGVGGLGSGVAQHLAGLGVRRMTLVDFDVVEERNFARQFTYGPAQLGLPKVDQVAAWLKGFDPGIDARAVNARVETAEFVDALLDGVDLVVAAIDAPGGDLLVNRACVARGVPFIRGGLSYTQGSYWSVDPGRSACAQCLDNHRNREVAESAEPHVVTWARLLDPIPPNRANGPVAGMLAALVGMEALRYLTGFVAPVSAGEYRLVDFSRGCETSRDPWAADPECAVCATAPARQR
ncbi:ThiF family adenylyltransferase [Microbispora sp. ATCC PTA-5024]|uniref:ThiF family adenylyltransferase n=1 Tax=Microbispora sp. ATCC PTA-5024 TaxID=316330 RepID=UPI0003DDEC2A|nr:ThiF family adenylyltransferase [Microbispora sp. ATCC PTA-5024]ETK32814.1 hypothetical protein MPTA5024_27775 [Microbispora sp. ATCC PTA-5024]